MYSQGYIHVFVLTTCYSYMYSTCSLVTMLTLASVPSTQYPATITPFLLSVHHASNSCLDRPLCIIPGLANITQGPISSKLSIFCEFTNNY